MTMALCMTCGNTKFGAICPCTKCGVASTGDMNLDIAFSDHNMSVKTIEGFGMVIRAVAARTNEPGVRFWAFIKYVSDRHPTILNATPPPEFLERVEHVLAQGGLPEVAFEKSPQKVRSAERAKDVFELALPDRCVDSIVATFRRFPPRAGNPLLEKFPVLCKVEVQLVDGRILKDFSLMVVEGRAVLSRHGWKESLRVEEIKALRRPFRFMRAFSPRPWVVV